MTRTVALCSLVSALTSLSFGVVYIMRFDNMRSMYRVTLSPYRLPPAHLRQQEAQKIETAIFWNVWVLFAPPGIWLAWSVPAFVVAIMSFVWPWRTDASGEKHISLSTRAELGPRIGITCQVLRAFVIRTFGIMERLSAKRTL